MPIPLSQAFNRLCISIQNGNTSIPLVCTLIEKKGIFYLNVFHDVAPAIMLYNQTDIDLVVAQTSASENSLVTNTMMEYEGQHFEWYQAIPSNSICYYTPPVHQKTFPELEMIMCNLTLAKYCGEFAKLFPFYALKSYMIFF